MSESGYYSIEEALVDCQSLLLKRGIDVISMQIQVSMNNFNRLIEDMGPLARHTTVILGNNSTSMALEIRGPKGWIIVFPEYK